MKIVHVIARLNIGGPAIYVIQLASRLAEAGEQVLVIKGQESASEGNMLEMADAWGVAPTTIGTLRREVNPFRDLLALVRLVRILRRERPDVVQTHTAKAGTLGRIAARIAGVPCVIHTFHGHVFHGYFSASVTRAILAVERWLAHHTTRIITLTQIQRRDILRHGIGQSERVRVVPLGLDLQRFLDLESKRGQLREELGVPADRFLVGIVARLVPIKNVGLFIDAVHRCSSPDIDFLIIGDGEMRSELESRAADLGLHAPRLRFLGFRHDLEQIYADLDLAVLTSHNEGSPVAVLEAMTAGIPVVATAVGGVPDLVIAGETGDLVSPDDAPALAEAIERHAEDRPKSLDMGQRGRAHVYPEYDLSTLVPRMMRLYSEALDSTGPNGGIG